MLTRQKIFLRFMEMCGGSLSKIHLVKMAFLLSKESPSKGGNAYYQFLPFKYGPFSFGLYQEMAAFVKKGLVLDDGEKHWKLTPEGRQSTLILPEGIESDIRNTFERYKDMTTDELMDSVYCRYPWYTINSVKNEKRAYIRPKANIAIYSIGYEGLLVDGFLDILLRNGIQRLIDVRFNPVARKYGFHKSTLSRLCGKLDIEYIHIPELGIQGDKRNNLHSLEDYKRLFEEYEQKVLIKNKSILGKVGEMMEEKVSALMCMEADHQYCHRTRIAESILSSSTLPLKNISTFQ